MKIFVLVFILFNFVFIVQAHSQTRVIEMTPDGFVPDSVTIDNNSAAIFINKDNRDRWPASNTHPTHHLYPEFDPKKPVKPGESWSFKPKKAGEWKYHDHLLPHIRGVITVVSEDGENIRQTTFPFQNFLTRLRNKISSLFRLGRKTTLPDSAEFVRLSYQEQQKILEQTDAQKSWVFIKTTFKNQAGSSGNIHDLAHLSGGLLFEEMGFEGLGKCSSDFAFGCYHGFLDNAFKKDLDHLLDAHEACSKLDASLSGPVASCIHGIGHGVASFYLVSDLKKALTTCRKLESGFEYCFDGVFMEFARNAPESYLKKDDLLYPCSELEKQFAYVYSSACGRNQPSLLMSRHQMSFEQVIPICLGSNSAPFKDSCIDSLGFSLASSGESQKIIQGCRMINDESYIKKCIKASAGELVFQDVPGWEQKSKEVCAGFPAGNSECLEYINRLKTEYKR